MRKITLCLVFVLACCWQSFSQTLNQNAMWPNTNWTVTGTFNMDPSAYEADPTLTSNFAFDDDDAGSGSDDIIAAESPVINLTAAHTAGETWITISGDFVYNYNSDDILQFEYWDADAETWNIIGQPFNADTSGAPTDDFCSGTAEAYSTEVLDIAAFSATQLSGFRYRIYFDDLVGAAGYEWGFCFQSPTITSAAPPTCLEPINFVVTDITDTSATVSWDAGGSETAWESDVILASEPEPSSVSPESNTSYSVVSLTPETEYTAYLRADCGGDFSDFISISFTTLAAPPACGDTYVDSGGTDGDYGNNENETITICPDNPGDVVSLNFTVFSAENQGTGCYDGLTIYNGADNTAATIDPPVGGTIWCWDRDDTTPSGSGDLQGQTIIATNASGCLTLTFTSDGSSTREGWEAAITCGPPPACPNPSALSADNITPGSVDLSWTENGTATSWNIELVDVTAGGTANGTATVSGVTNPYMATGLASDNDYEYYVQAVCDGDVSDWVGPFTFSTPVSCPAPSGLGADNITDTSADLSWDDNADASEWNLEWGTAGFEQGSGTSVYVTPDSNYALSEIDAETAYEFYVQAVCSETDSSAWTGPFSFTTLATPPDNDNLCDATMLTVGQAGVEGEYTNVGATTQADEPAGDCFSGGAQSTVWFEFLADTDGEYTISTDIGGTQTDSEIAIYAASEIDCNDLTSLSAALGCNQDGGTVVGSGFMSILSVTLTSGAYYVQVSGWNNNIGTFGIEVMPPPTCPDPSTLTAENITAMSADLGWTENGSASTWNIEWGAAGFEQGMGTQVSTMDNPYALDSLTPETAYEFYVQADCDGDLSAWVGPYAFATPELCPTPSNVSVSNVTGATAEVSWTENGSSTAWHIEVVQDGSSPTGSPTYMAITLNPLTIAGLTPETTYSVYVQADCGDDGKSQWVQSGSFTTRPADPTCENGVFVDDGGASNDYSPNEETTYTICPDDAGDVVQVTFTFFSTENSLSGCYDGLTIHDGADATAATIDPPGGGTIWCWDRDETTPSGTGDLQGMSISSTDASGCLTFVFTSDGSVQREGWEAMVECNPLSLEETVLPSNGFAYYPNPVENVLSIRAQANVEQVDVYNMLGQQVLTTKPMVADSDVDMSGLQAGAYFVKVSINNQVKTIKVIKD